MQRRFFAWLAAKGREEQFGEGRPYGPDGTFSRRETYELIAILRTGATPVQRWNAAYVLSHPIGDRLQCIDGNYIHGVVAESVFKLF